MKTLTEDGLISNSVAHALPRHRRRQREGFFLVLVLIAIVIAIVIANRENLPWVARSPLFVPGRAPLHAVQLHCAPGWD